MRRRLLVALSWLVPMSQALAGDLDLPMLRGSSPYIPAAPVYTNWSGFYVGGQAGYGGANVNFAGATQSLLAMILQQLAIEDTANVNPPPSQWAVLGKATNQGPSYGGFVGYNSQWDNVVLGIDFNLSHSHYFASAQSVSPPLERVVSAGGNAYDVTVSGNASLRIEDFMTARGRVGYVFNSFMPYATFGAALGLVDYARTANVFIIQNPPTPPAGCLPPSCATLSQTSTDSKNKAYVFGYAVGAGLDVLVFPNVFLRAEYEYVSLGSVGGINASINTGRVGAAFKF